MQHKLLLASYCDELVGYFQPAIPAVQLAPCHQGVGLTTSDEAPGREERAG